MIKRLRDVNDKNYDLLSDLYLAKENPPHIKSLNDLTNYIKYLESANPRLAEKFINTFIEELFKN